MKWKFDRAGQQGLLAGVCALAILVTLAGGFLNLVKEREQRSAREIAQTFAFRIALRTNEAASPAYMLAAMVKEHRGKIPDFDKLASELLPEFPLARALELAPAGVVRQVYPLRGNEAIIGHDLLKDGLRNKDAHTAVVRRELMLAGPFELIQGGVGSVARYPIYMRGDQGKDAFWGFAIVLIHVKELLINAGSLQLERNGLDYSICRVLPGGSECQEFAHTGGGELLDPVAISIELPLNVWRLSVAPRSGWVPFSKIVAIFSLAVIGALLVAYFRYRMLLGEIRAKSDMAATDDSALPDR